MNNLIVSALALLAPALLVQTASADLIAYTDRAAFVTDTLVQATDLFEDMSCSATTATPLMRTLGEFSYTVTTGEDGLYNSCQTPGTSLSTNYAADAVMIDGFTGGATAIGGYFFATNVAGEFLPGESVEISATDSMGGQGAVTVVVDSLDQFNGFRASAGAMITSLTFKSVQRPDASIWPALNSLVLAK